MILVVIVDEEKNVSHCHTHPAKEKEGYKKSKIHQSSSNFSYNVIPISELIKCIFDSLNVDLGVIPVPELAYSIFCSLNLVLDDILIPKHVKCTYKYVNLASGWTIRTLNTFIHLRGMALDVVCTTIYKLLPCNSLPCVCIGECLLNLSIYQVLLVALMSSINSDGDGHLPLGWHKWRIINKCFMENQIYQLMLLICKY